MCTHIQTYTHKHTHIQFVVSLPIHQNVTNTHRHMNIRMYTNIGQHMYAHTYHTWTNHNIHPHSHIWLSTLVGITQCMSTQVHMQHTYFIQVHIYTSATHIYTYRQHRKIRLTQKHRNALGKCPYTHHTWIHAPRPTYTHTHTQVPK